MNANDPVADYNLGCALAAQGKLDEAGRRFERAISLKPDYIDAYNKLALTFFHRGHVDPALGVLRRAIQIGATSETKALFVQFLRSVGAIPNLDDLRDLMVRALSEPWARPSAVSPIAAALIKNDERLRGFIERANSAWPKRLPAQDLLGSAGISAVSRSRLLIALMQSAPITDLALEKFLTALRSVIMEIASGAASPAVENNVLAFGCAVAQQCYLNEYVYSRTDDELECACRLRDQLRETIADGAHISGILIAGVAAYFPLHSLPGAAALLDRPWPEAVSSLLVQQVREPADEWRLAAAIPALTAIDDQVSLKVRQQYEENPYPRWTKTEPASRPTPIDQFLRDQFPLARIWDMRQRGNADILVAGCGTGQQAIETALRFPQASVLAIDLSRASLAYGLRKTRELGIDRIEYVQADILKLASIGRTFDLIAAVGVLHHLADPFAGWRVLVALLRPGGVMAVGLYSERARTHITAAREFIAERRFLATPDDIRQCRQELMALADGAPAKLTLGAEDFFSTSECRDLLFHVEEHRHTLPEIATFLADNDLEFLGFDLRAAVRQRYRSKFPTDPAMIDLEFWHVFECENPNTFVGMYQFWIQRRTS